jgi:hypothetical protein
MQRRITTMSETLESKMPNKGGAPLGNKNALKHGFYAHSFHRTESRNLDTDILGQFEDEIALMRVLILRTAESIKDNPQLSLMEYLTALRGVTHAVACLAAVYRTQKSVYNNGMTTIEQAMEELANLPVEED